ACAAPPSGPGKPGPGQLLWSIAESDDVLFPGSATTDPSGNVIVTGDFEHQGSIGCDMYAATTLGVYLAKFVPDGRLVWSKSFNNGDPANDIESASLVATDASGNILLTGAAGGTPDFGGGPLPGGAQLNLYVAKFDPDGNHLWSKRLGQNPMDGF